MPTNSAVFRTLLLTGPPGVGKTSLMMRVYTRFTELGTMVSGILTQEVRVNGVRTGFKIRNVASGEEGWLARVGPKNGPKVGNYTVNTLDLESIGTLSLENAARGESPLILIDEVGPMEMTSDHFRFALRQILTSRKTVLASVKYGSHYSEIEEASRLPRTRNLTVSPSNRDQLYSEIVSLIDNSLSGQRGR